MGQRSIAGAPWPVRCLCGRQAAGGRALVSAAMLGLCFQGLGAVSADAGAAAAVGASGGVTVARIADGNWLIQASAARWEDLAAAVQSATGVVMHRDSAVSPEAVTISCAVPTVESLIECVAGPGAEVIFVHTGVPATTAGPPGTIVAAHVHVAPPALPSSTQTGGGAEVIGLTQQRDSDMAPADAKTDRPLVSLLARRGSAAASVLADPALHNSDVVMRAETVTQLGLDSNGIALIRRALDDADEDVRSLAQTKLELAKELAQRIALDAGASGGGLRGRR